MKRQRTVISSILAPLAIFAMLVAISGLAQAQFLDVTTVEVKAGATGSFEENVKKAVEAANKINAPQGWAAFQVDRGLSGFTYMFATPFAKWGETDGWKEVPQIMVEAFGEEEATKILRTWGSTFANLHATTSRELPELSTHNKSFDDLAPRYRVIRTQVKPEMEGEYLRFLAKIKAAQEKASSVTWIRRVSAVGTLSTYTAVRRFSKFADLDGGGVGAVLQAMYGEEEAARVMADGQKCVVKREIYDLRYRPELSRAVSPGATN